MPSDSESFKGSLETTDGTAAEANRYAHGSDPAKMLEKISEALDVFHMSLTAREHGYLAAWNFAKKCEEIFGRHWSAAGPRAGRKPNA